MEFELDEGHWLFPIFDFTGRSFGIGRWTFLSDCPIKLQIKTSGLQNLPWFLLFPNNEPPFLLPVHWWWDRMWKMWQMEGWPTWKYYFLLTHHLLLASMGAPIWSALTKLTPPPLLQNLSFDLKFERIRERKCRKVLYYNALVWISPYEFPWEQSEVESWRWHDGESGLNWDVSFRNGHHLLLHKGTLHQKNPCREYIPEDISGGEGRHKCTSIASAIFFDWLQFHFLLLFVSTAF